MVPLILGGLVAVHQFATIGAYAPRNLVHVLLERAQERPTQPAFVDGAIEAYATPGLLGDDLATVAGAVDAVAVGRAGFAWSGTATIARKARWPRWVPPPCWALP